MVDTYSSYCNAGITCELGGETKLPYKNSIMGLIEGGNGDERF